MKKLTETNKSTSRRTFIKASAAGAGFMMIPAKSVWANGVANSIVASGHGSDWAGGRCITLLSPGYWKNHPSEWPSGLLFSDIFGDLLGTLKVGSDSPEDATLLDVISNPGGGGTLKWNDTSKKGQLGGEANVNYFMVAMYANAYNSGNDPVWYPVGSGGGHGAFGSPELFAAHLYSEASAAPESVGKLLSAMIDLFHAPDGSSTDYTHDEIPQELYDLQDSCTSI